MRAFRMRIPELDTNHDAYRVGDMSLTDDDWARLRTETRLGVIEGVQAALKDHVKDKHEELEKKVDGIQRWQWLERGVVAILAGWLGFK